VLPDWVNAVPTASGLTSPDGDRSRNIDLVHRISADKYEFVELKISSNNPLMAAMELLQYFLIFVFAQRTFHSLAHQPTLLNAQQVHLRVLAPQPFYDGYDLRWLERELQQGVVEVTKDDGIVVDFAFLAFPVDFKSPCADHLLEDAMARRSAPRWRIL